jgi:hypothetical protein
MYFLTKQSAIAGRRGAPRRGPGEGEESRDCRAGRDSARARRFVACVRAGGRGGAPVAEGLCACVCARAPRDATGTVACTSTTISDLIRPPRTAALFLWRGVWLGARATLNL